MQGKPKVILELQKLLEFELSAFDQYFIHARMYADWDLNQLAERITHEAEEERQHAQLLIDRILFLEGIPNLSKRTPLTIGKDVPEMLNNDLQYEYQVAVALRSAIQLCEKEMDFQTRQVLLKLLADTEEDHMYWLEKQLGLITKLGIANYLQMQR